jgi:hypothetical protein
MAYVVRGSGEVARNPYRVQYVQGGRRRVKKFASLGQAESFRRRLPMGADSKIRLVAGNALLPTAGA